MKKYLFVGMRRSYGKVYVVDLESFTISYSKQLIPHGLSAEPVRIRTLDDGDIYIGFRFAPDSTSHTYLRVGSNLNILDSFTEDVVSNRATPILNLLATEVPGDPIVYTGYGISYAASRNKNFELLEVVGGKDTPYPYFSPETTALCWQKSSIIAHDPDHDKLFWYYGGERSANYYYWTSIYCVPLDDMESVPNGDFKAIGQSFPEILRDHIGSFLHYLDDGGIPYLFCSGIDWNISEDGHVRRLVKARLTDPWTITKTGDALHDYIAFPDRISAPATQQVLFLHNGYLYLIGSGEGNSLFKAITVMNPDTLSVEEHYEYGEEEVGGEAVDRFQSGFLDEEDEIIYVGTEDGKLLKINMETMSIVDHINFEEEQMVLEIQPVKLVASIPILNVSQPNNKIKVGWGYDV